MIVVRIKIESTEQYYSMIDAAKKRWGRLWHNAYFLADFLNEQITKGRLSALLYENALLFFVDKDQFSQLYFYTQAQPLICKEQHRNEETVLLKELKKPLVGSLIGVIPPQDLPAPKDAGCFPDDKIPAKLRPGCNILSELGLKRIDCYYHMSADSIDWQGAYDFMDFSFSTATTDQIPEIKRLLNAVFPLLTSDLPEEEELVRLIQKQESYSLLDSSGQLCGYCQFEAQGSKHMLRHLVIAPQYQGCHLAGCILKYLSNAFPNQPSFLWVREDNAAAAGLYRKCGYGFDGRILINYSTNS